jgi:hypothetical protein
MKETVGIEETSLLFFSQESNEINAPLQPCGGKSCTQQTISLSYPIATKFIAGVASRKTRQLRPQCRSLRALRGVLSIRCSLPNFF